MNLHVIPMAALLAAASLLHAQDPAPRPEKVAHPIPATPDVKAPAPIDPGKGAPELSPLTDAERAAMRAPEVTGPVAAALQKATPVAAGVLYGIGSDGRLWVSGASYKASFGAEGFTYIPFLGSDAPRNHPVHFALRSVRAGGVELPFTASVQPRREGDRVTFDRGGVREIYDVSAQGVEQTFVVDHALAGDVEIDMQVETDLQEAADLAGLQFGNARGHVEYGTAYVVHGTEKQEIESAFADDVLRLRVPAAMRRAGAVVVDPVIRTEYAGFALQDLASPDLAYDVSNDRYLLVWQRTFSAADRDIFGEMRDGNGLYVSGTSLTIDNSAEDWFQPRVANLNAYDRFLVGAQEFLAANSFGHRYRVVGRTVNAGSPHAIGPATVLSGGELGDKTGFDLGGDPDTVSPTYWTIVYTRELSSTDTDVHARQVSGAGVPRANTIMLENSGNSVYFGPRISRSNGMQPFGSQRWLVVYSYRAGAADYDVYGAALSWDGQILQPNTGIATSTLNELNPEVSSATDLVAGSPTYGIAWRRTSSNDFVGKVVSGNFSTIVGTEYLTGLLGIGDVRSPTVETDGSRFVFACISGPAAYVATLGVIGSSFQVHESLQAIGTGYQAAALQLASRRTGGGSRTGFATVFVDAVPNPDRIVFAAYEGRGPGGVTTRPTGCGGLGLVVSGRPVLGEAMTFTLSGIAVDACGMLLGVPASLDLCAGCKVGVNLGGPLVNLPGTTMLPLFIPNQHALVGSTLSVQGYAAGSGNCFARLRLSDTADVVLQ